VSVLFVKLSTNIINEDAKLTWLLDIVKHSPNIIYVIFIFFFLFPLVFESSLPYWSTGLITESLDHSQAYSLHVTTLLF
jgi:hypothetical protein